MGLTEAITTIRGKMDMQRALLIKALAENGYKDGTVSNCYEAHERAWNDYKDEMKSLRSELSYLKMAVDVIERLSK